MKILEAFSICFEENDIWEIIRKADECYYRKFNSDKDFVQYIMSVQDDVPVDFVVNNGCYFRRN